MENVSMDNYGGSWKWHATSGDERKAYRGARALAMRTFGPRVVAAVEWLVQDFGDVDPHIFRYLAEWRGLVQYFGPGLCQNCDLLKTPAIEARRYSDYQRHARSLGLRVFASLPSNWALIADAANGCEKSKTALARAGQWGLGADFDAELPDCGPTRGESKSSLGLQRAIGSAIANLRQAAGLTQAQAAAKASSIAGGGYTQGRWSDLEAGRFSPTLETLQVIAQVLGVRVGRLLGDL
ncbi:MAG: helix-turn-helix domain-containing protein [Phycisphaerae bacterium]